MLESWNGRDVPPNILGRGKHAFKDFRSIFIPIFKDFRGQSLLKFSATISSFISLEKYINGRKDLALEWSIFSTFQWNHNENKRFACK